MASELVICHVIILNICEGPFIIYSSYIFYIYIENHCTMTLDWFTWLCLVGIECKFYEKSDLEMSNKNYSECSSIQNAAYEQG